MKPLRSRATMGSFPSRRTNVIAASKVSAEVWGEALAAMLVELKAGRLAEGMIATVEKVGVVLAEHFPRTEGDVNELPDRLIEV